MFESPVFWGIVVFVAVLAYLMGTRARDRAATPASAPVAEPPVASPARGPVGSAGRPAPAGRQSADRVPSPVAGSTGRQAGRPRLSEVTSWGYQLQDLDLARAAASPFDLLVIDYTRDGSEETRLTAAEIERLKRKPDGSRRLVVAYVSVGEAESYRPYWRKSWKRDKPTWLLRENPEWPENYAVCFWDPGWQELMCGAPEAYLDRVQAQGFDGVYLDKCDVYEDLRRHERKVAATRPALERDMVEFVKQISQHLKARDPGFVVIMQNAEGLLAHPDLVAAIDGVGKEELVYGVDAPEKKNGDDEIAWAKGCLDRAKKAGKQVLVVEYLANHDKIQRAAAIVADCGYVLYVAPKDRELKRLNYDVLEA